MLHGVALTGAANSLTVCRRLIPAYALRYDVWGPQRSSCWTPRHALHFCGEKERQKVELLLGVVNVIVFDAAAARQTGQVLGELAKEGLPIGDFDSQIAGHALTLSAILVTDNVKHFGRVNGLQVLEWVPAKKGNVRK